MANKILDSFIRTMPRLQARNIERDLQRPEERLRYRTAAEFREAFQGRLRQLLGRDSDIRFGGMQFQEDSYKESEMMNEAFSLIAGDLSSLFSEATDFLKLEELQAQIFNNEVVDRLRKATAEAETEIERLELLRGNVSGLKEAIVEKFNSGADRLSRSAPHAQTTYVDPKLNIEPPPSLDMPVGLYVGGLVLPLSGRSPIHVGIDFVDNNKRMEQGRRSLPQVIQTRDLGQALFGSLTTAPIGNAIGEDYNSSWEASYLPPQTIPGGATVSIVLTIHPGAPAINYLEIHPVGEFDQELASVFYEDEVEEAVEIDLQVSPVKLTEPIRLNFREVNARRVILTLRQKNSTAINMGFENPAPDGEEQLDLSRRMLHRYTFGLRNVSVGQASYQSLGYYVSRTLTLPKINKLFLKASENSFAGVSGGEALSPDTNPLPLIEYWVAVREIDGGGIVVDSKFLPILSAGLTQVREKLEVNQSGKASLSFMIDPEIDTNGDQGDVDDLIVYRNGVALLRGVDYSFEPPATALAQPAILSIPQGYLVQDEYVAKYTPLHTQTALAPVQFTDRTRLVRYNSDNTISLKRPESSRAVRSEANLIVIMRGLGNGKHTAIVDEFTFAVG